MPSSPESLNPDAFELFKVMMEYAVSESQAQADAAFLEKRRHQVEIIELLVGPKAGQCIVVIRCDCNPELAPLMDCDNVQ